MESLALTGLLSWCSGVFTFYLLWKFAHTTWFRPKWLERKLRQQGIDGTRYRFLYGDMNDFVRTTKEAMSRPMNLADQIGERVQPFQCQIVERYGKISMFWLGPTPRLIVTEPQLVRSILNDKNGDVHKPVLNPLVRLITQGLSTLEGQKWMERRKLITPVFHYQKLKDMMPAFLTSCCAMIDRWNELVGPGGSFEIDVAQEFQALTGDVICRTAFGISHKEGHRIFSLQKEQSTLMVEAAYSVYFPGKRFLPTKKNRRIYQIDREIKSILREIICKKEVSRTNGALTNDDLLGVLLDCKEQAGSNMTLNDVFEECKLFFLAGQETTASLLTWTLVMLSIHKNWQDIAREEVLQVCGMSKPNADSLNQLKTVTMILYEVLRLYPPVIAQARDTHKPTEVGNRMIPPGVQLFLPILMLHRDPEYWGEDANEFKPERFSAGISNASKIAGGGVFFPFGWGPRVCLGQNFAMLEVKLSLAMILQHFYFELSPSYVHAPVSILSLQPDFGAPVILHPT